REDQSFWVREERCSATPFTATVDTARLEPTNLLISRSLCEKSRSARYRGNVDVSAEARALHDDADVIDLHVDSFIWRRIFGYDFRRRHTAFTRGVMMSQFDLPRAR